MNNVFDFSLSGLDGAPMPLAQFKGKVVLLVNTASACGFTPQYEGLEKLWKANKDKGLVIVGVPCNDFGEQELGDAYEIGAFCQKNFGVTFPLSAKYSVRGADAIPLYKWASDQAGLLGRPKWNFHKYLFGRDGELIDWFASATSPTGPKISKALAAALA